MARHAHPRRRARHDHPLSGRTELRRVESADDLATAATLAREFGDWASAVIRDRLGIDVPAADDHPTEALDELLAGGGRLYVALLDGEPAGVGGLKLLADGAGEIKRMYVRPAARGHGLGRAIVLRLLEDARELGCTTVQLESASFMHEAHALYRSVGFAPGESYAGREFEGSEQDVSVFMRLDLA